MNIISREILRKEDIEEEVLDTIYLGENEINSRSTGVTGNN